MFGAGGEGWLGGVDLVPFTPSCTPPAPSGASSTTSVGISVSGVGGVGRVEVAVAGLEGTALTAIQEGTLNCFLDGLLLRLV